MWKEEKEMPVMGPDLKYARNVGREAAKEILQLLQDKYKVYPARRTGTPILDIFADDKERAIAQIVSGVKDLLILDHCEAW
jgi:hypothetical protein